MAGDFSQGGTFFIRDGDKIDNLAGDLRLQKDSLVLSREGTVSAKKKVEITNEDLTREELEEIEQYEATASAIPTLTNANDSTNEHESDEEDSRGFADSISVDLRKLYKKVKNVFEVKVAGRALAYLDNTGRFFARIIGTPKVETDVITPFNTGDLSIKLGETRGTSENISEDQQEISENPSSPPSRFKILNAEDTEVASIDAKGEATFTKVNVKEATQSAEQEEPTESIGSGTIVEGREQVLIRTSTITEESKIFLTPTSSTNGQALFVLDKNAGNYFIAKVDRPASTDIAFDWWVVN